PIRGTGTSTSETPGPAVVFAIAFMVALIVRWSSCRRGLPTGRCPFGGHGAATFHIPSAAAGLYASPTAPSAASMIVASRRVAGHEPRHFAIQAGDPPPGRACMLGTELSVEHRDAQIERRRPVHLRRLGQHERVAVHV